MSSTYSTLNRLELMADGEKNNTWGQITNSNIGTLIEELISGMETVNCAGSSDVTLTANNGATDQARNMILKCTGVLTGNISLIIPAKSHLYVVWNATSGSFTLTVKTSGGAGTTITQGQKMLVFCDGTDTWDAISDREKIGRKSMWVPARAMEPAITGGCQSLAVVEISSTKPNISTLDFDSGSAEFAEFEVAMPKSWDEGTVTFKAYWTTTVANTLGVAWTLRGVAVGDNEAVDGTYGTAITVVDNNQSSANRRLISTESAAITVGGTPTAGESVTFRIGRDPANGSDDLATDAKLMGIMIFFNTDAGNDV